MLSRRTILLITLCTLAALALANIYSPRTPAEKVAAAELIVYGVVTLEGQPLTNTPSPVKRSCKVQVLETLWPTNSQLTNTFIVDHWVWARWPDTWWNYNSTTGVYFSVSTSNAVQIARQRERLRPTGLTIRDKFYGTNKWMPLDRFDDWYEPETNLANIKALTGTRTGSLPRTSFRLMKREITLSKQQPFDHFLGARLIEVASDGTTTIEILNTTNRLQAAVGVFFTSPEYGRSGLKVLSASHERQEVRLERTWCE
jgi:hypothetical protein